MARAAFKAWFPLGVAARPAYPVMRLVCFHGAGSDSFLYMKASGEGNALVKFCEENQIELLAAHLPGRTVRSGEGLMDSIPEIASAVLDALEASGRLGDEICELCVVGHSMGGFVAYEFLRELKRRKGATPRALFVCCMIPPSLAVEDRLWAEEKKCDDTKFREQMRAWSASATLFEPDTWKTYEPILRADLRAVDRYPAVGEGENEESFGVPPKAPLVKALHTWSAAKDCFVPEECMSDWARCVGVEAVGEHKVIEGCTHNVSNDVKGRAVWFGQLVDELEKIMLDLEYS